MSKRSLETTENPDVIVRATGKLYLRGWERNEVRASGPDEGLVLEMDGEMLLVSSEESLQLRVPHGASIRITAYDEVTVRNIEGSVHIEQAGDSLILRNLGEAHVATVGNDLTARGIAGNLSIDQAGRFVTVREVGGDFQAAHIGSHANLRAIAGSVELSTGGNATLSVNPTPGTTVAVRAEGAVVCKVGAGLDAGVRIESGGPIRVRAGEVREKLDDGVYEATFGDGAASISLFAGGKASLIERSSEPERPEIDINFSLGEELAGIGAEVGSQVAEHLGMIEEEFETRFSGFSDLLQSWDVPPEKAEEIQRRTQEKVNRAQEKIRRAQERAARRIADAQRRAEAEARRAGRRSKSASGRSFNINLRGLRKRKGPKAEPVSDEERLMILNMVAEKKITLEEAEALLAALEGK